MTLTAEHVAAIVLEAWDRRDEHVHGIELHVSPDGAHFRVDVATDSVRTLTVGDLLRRQARDVAHLQALWNEHQRDGTLTRPAVLRMSTETKHLYFHAERGAEHVRDLIAKGCELLVDMKDGRPVHEDHAAIDDNEIPIRVTQWQILFRRPL